MATKKKPPATKKPAKPAANKPKIRHDRFNGGDGFYALVSVVEPGQPEPEDAIERMRRVLAEKEAADEAAAARKGSGRLEGPDSVAAVSIWREGDPKPPDVFEVMKQQIQDAIRDGKLPPDTKVDE
jgi:hypothetical protein